MDIRSFPRPPREPGSLKPAQPPLERESRSSRSEGRRRRKARREEKAKALMIRTIVLGVFALGGLIVVIGIGILRNKHAGSAVWEDPAAVEAAKMKSFGVAVPGQSELLAMVRKVLAVRTEEDLGQRVRLDGASPGEAMELLSRLRDADGKIHEIACDQSFVANGIQIETVRVTFDRDGLLRNRIAMLTPDQNGIWQFDLAAYARKQSMGWDDVLGGPARVAELRVHTVHDSYYNGAYRDEQAWSCYGLNSEDTETLFQGYCAKGGKADETLTALLRNRRPARVIVRFRREEKAGSRQGEILSVVAEDWVRTDTPFDGQLPEESPPKGD